MSTVDQDLHSTTKNRLLHEHDLAINQAWYNSFDQSLSDRNLVTSTLLKTPNVQVAPVGPRQHNFEPTSPLHHETPKGSLVPKGTVYPVATTNNPQDIWMSNVQNLPTPSSVPLKDFLSPAYSSDNFSSDISTSASSFRDGTFWTQAIHNVDDHISNENQNRSELASQFFPDHQNVSHGPETNNPLVLTPDSGMTTTPPTFQIPMQLTNSQPQICCALFTGPSMTAQTAEPAPNHELASPESTDGSDVMSNVKIPDPSAKSTTPLVYVTSHDQEELPDSNVSRKMRPRSKRSRSSNLSGSSDSEVTDSSGDQPRGREDSPQTFDDDPSDLPDERTGFSGFDPTLRGDEYVPSLQDMEEAQKVAEKNADVEDWLEKSEVGSEIDSDEPIPLRKKIAKKSKPRALSAGARTSRQSYVNDRQLPGPGALIDEESEDEDEDEDLDPLSDPESPPAHVEIERQQPGLGYFPALPPNEAHEAVENDEALVPQTYRPQPWYDPFKGTPIVNEPNQPDTANAAMYKYELQAARIETASRAATWGTRRRISDSDIRSLLSDESSLRRLSLTPLPSPSGRSRKSSIFSQALDQARGIIRKSSINKARSSSPIPESPNQTLQEGDREGSVERCLPVQQVVTINKGSRSPSLSTSNAFVAMTGQMASIGGNGSFSTSVISPRTLPSKNIKRQRSKSEISSLKASGTPGLTQLMTNLGGPPIPILASPPHGRRDHDLSEPLNHKSIDGAADELVKEEDTDPGKGVKMNFNVYDAHIVVPNLEGFKAHARDLNPRIADFLLDRVASEQLRRYKKLLEHKLKHVQAVGRNRKCPSGKHCNVLGDGPTILEPRRSAKDPTSTTQFAIPGADSDDENIDYTEGAVNPAAFPEGIPLPPTTRLPAEFECALCFKVKKFQKPSDWTKHVHEDVQPFTCTFPRCTEPKSFKRKADWVRHENERHRQLEWWQCNVPECRHICYRKDNFVQHLVREHKKPEPKVKPRGSTNKAALAEAREIDEVWRVVDECHRETNKKPRDEPCKFCGNVCNSWKRLTVHLARHMEQVSLPVLKIVDHRDVSPDTVISPVPPLPKLRYSESVSPTAIKVEKVSASPVAAASFMAQERPTSMTERLSSTPTMPQLQQPVLVEVSPYSPMGQYSASEVNAFPQQAGYGVPYLLNTSQPPPTGSSVNYGTASTYPPPFNAIPRHLQQGVSPAPSATSHPSYGMNLEPVYTSQAGSIAQPMFASPIEGTFRGLADPRSIGLDMNMEYAANSQGPYSSYEGSNAGTPGYLGHQY